MNFFIFILLKKMAKPLPLFFILFLVFKITINQLQSSVVEINEVLDSEIGKKGPVLFYTDNELLFPDDSNRTIAFIKNILDENNNTYQISCGPWVDMDTFIIFCEFNESFPEGKYFLNLMIHLIIQIIELIYYQIIHSI